MWCSFPLPEDDKRAVDKLVCLSPLHMSVTVRVNKKGKKNKDSEGQTTSLRFFFKVIGVLNYSMVVCF